MKDKQSLHQKIQELCDCFTTTDFLTEMATIKNETDEKEAALKWLALAVLHGINENVEKISISRKESGDVKVTAEYRKKDLPSPENKVAANIIDAVNELAHFEKFYGRTQLSLGIRDSSVDLKIEMKKKPYETKLVINFP